MKTTRAKTSTKLPNPFIGKSSPPSGNELSAALGAAAPLWKRLLAVLSKDLELTAEWGSSSPKLGWSLRMKKGEKIVLYLVPTHDSFRASFVLGDKALKAALAAGLPANIVESIQTAKKFAEGTPVHVHVTGPDNLPAVKTLAIAKLGIS